MPKQKVTITVDKRLLDWVSLEVEKLRFRNRSHTLEYALARLMEAEKKG